MARWVRTVSAWVLVAFVATVLSPHFAWEAVASDAHHERDHDSGQADAHAAADSGDTMAQDHHDGHVCAGHQFGHLPLHFSSLTLPVVAPDPSVVAPGTVAFVPAGFTDTPLRPPRFHSFA